MGRVNLSLITLLNENIKEAFSFIHYLGFVDKKKNNLSCRLSSYQATIINLLNNKSRNYRTKKNWNREWKLIFFLESFSFFINSIECNKCVNSRYHVKDIVLKRNLILRATCENGLIDKASTKFVNFWICKLYFPNLKWELLLTKKKYFRPSRCTMKQTLD